MSVTYHAQFRHHRNATEDDISNYRRSGLHARVFAIAGLVLSVAALATMTLRSLGIISILCIFCVALGSLCAIRAVVLDTYVHRHAAEEASPHPLTAVAASVCAVAVIATIILTGYGLLGPQNLVFLNKRTWTLQNDGWARNGHVVSFTAGISSSAGEPSGASPSRDASTASVSGTLASNMPSSTSSPSLSSLSSLLLFTGSNKTGETVQHNNALTDTDASDALAIESATIDNRTYGYYNGSFTLRNNTRDVILYADVAVTALSRNGDVLKQETAHCQGPVEPGQACEAQFQIGAQGAAALIPYTTMWFTSGDSSSVLAAASEDDEQHQDAAASRTAPGTVFHKATPGVPAIPL